MPFGAKQILKKTPPWAIWMFRIVFLFTTCATIVIAGETHITSEVKVRIGVYLKAFEAFVFGLSKMFGVTIEPNMKADENESNGEQPPT